MSFPFSSKRSPKLSPKSARRGALSVTTACLLVIAVGAQAGPGDRDGHRGPLEIATFEAKAAERLSAADANGDGQVNFEEFAAAAGERDWRGGPHGGPRERHKRMREGLRDRARNMTPEQREALKAEMREKFAAKRAEHEAEMFSTLDADGDGAISADEFAARDERKKERMQRHAFDRMDIDDDGLLTDADVAARIEKMRAADTNGDGQIDRAERREAYRARREARNGAAS